MIPLGVLAGSRPGDPTVLTSDSFNRAVGTLYGSYTDAAFGGDPLVWQGVRNSPLEISGNQVRSSTSAYSYASVDVGVSNVAVSAKITSMGAVNLHASAKYNNPTFGDVALRIYNDGSLTLSVDGWELDDDAPAGTVTSGDVVELVSKYPAISARVNGATVISGTDTSGFIPGTYAGFHSSTSGWRLDDFKVEGL